jgi:hypothetical protein
MLKHLPKVLLLAALLTTLAISSVPVFAKGKVCQCLSAGCFGGKNCPQGGCQFDKKTSQCVNTGCKGICY